jgi:RNA polymerase sigma-70 factor (ECF subfamily)
MIDWEGILERDGPAVWRTVYRLLGHRADAEDCFQEACVAALELSRRETVNHPRALLLRMATMRAMDRLRQRYRRKAVTEAAPEWDDLQTDDVAPLERAATEELSARLRTALAAIPERQAEAFCLCCLDEWSYAQAAEQLGTTPDSVGVLVHRARSKLRELLESARPTAGRADA